MAEHRAVEHDRDPVAAIVDERERRDAAGANPEHLVQQFGVAERETRRPERVGQPFQIDPAFLERLLPIGMPFAIGEGQQMRLDIRAGGGG